MAYNNTMSNGMDTNNRTKERMGAAQGMRVLFKKQLKSTPELKQVIQLYEQGAIKTATKAMEILQKHHGLSKDPAKQKDYLTKALKQPK